LISVFHLTIILKHQWLISQEQADVVVLDPMRPAHLRPDVQEYEFADATKALLEQEEQRVRGEKVLRVP
jgi:hypothetical protein